MSVDLYNGVHNFSKQEWEEVDMTDLDVIDQDDEEGPKGHPVVYGFVACSSPSCSGSSMSGSGSFMSSTSSQYLLDQGVLGLFEPQDMAALKDGAMELPDDDLVLGARPLRPPQQQDRPGGLSSLLRSAGVLPKRSCQPVRASSTGPFVALHVLCQRRLRVACHAK
jgi:hypothetical protein